MSSSHINVIAILYPKAAKYVEREEPGVLRYEIHRDLRASKNGTEDLVMVETYACSLVRQVLIPLPFSLRAVMSLTAKNVYSDQRHSYKDRDSFQVHGSSKMFQDFQKQLAQEDLMRAPMTLKLVGVKGGFLSRL
ncbi:hypothetical protein FH972_026930 [Carpinus fangiana]|uniref:Uncharacterized protein n=1 Tax=Carpinus fangiana TaxID=176857 RepID=A0A5N6L5T1_9ROSI|nr:hypothetical protein FH972_026930 [Carpinus fangiana]